MPQPAAANPAGSRGPTRKSRRTSPDSRISRPASVHYRVTASPEGRGDEAVIRDADGALQRQVGVLFEAGSLVGWGDGPLLDRFASGRDPASEAAFACAGRAARADGPPRLPGRAGRRARGARRLPGHVPRAGPQGAVGPHPRHDRPVAPRGRLAGRGAGPGGGAAEASPRAEGGGDGGADRSSRRSGTTPRPRSTRRSAGSPRASARRSSSATSKGSPPTARPSGSGVPVGTVRSRLYRGRDRLRGPACSAGVCAGGRRGGRRGAGLGDRPWRCRPRWSRRRSDWPSDASGPGRSRPGSPC